MAQPVRDWDSLMIVKRQYFQLIEPHLFRWLEAAVLKDPDVQAWLYGNLFNRQNLTHPPPERYQLRILKELVTKIEQATDDPEEDELSDDLISSLSSLLSSSIPADPVSAQRKSYVTYTFPPEGVTRQSSNERTITLLESRSVISSSGTTGLRTWEAALHLSSYLASADGNPFIRGKRVLELGAGTGLLSILSSKHLGAEYVMATDGDEGVVEALEANIFINGLEGSGKIQAITLRWGRTLVGSVIEDDSGGHSFDTVIGADITYDESVIPSMVSTLRELFELRPSTKVLIAATIRNEKTFDAFTCACKRNRFSIEDIPFVPVAMEEQVGPFYPTTTPIRLVHIKGTGVERDPFAINREPPQ